MHSRWVILAVLFLARTAMGFQFQSVATLSSFLIPDLNIDYTQLGLLIGFYLLPGTVIAYPSGLLGRRFGDKDVAILGMTLMVVGGVLTGASHDYAIFLVGRLISGIGAVLLNVLLTKMATDWFVGRELGTALALLVSSWPVGIGAALIVLPRLATAASVAAAFIFTAVAAAIVLVLIAAIYRVPTTAANTPPHAGRLGFGLSAREFGLVSLAGDIWALFNVGYIILISFAPSLLIAQGISVKDAGTARRRARRSNRSRHGAHDHEFCRVRVQHYANAEHFLVRAHCLHRRRCWPSVRGNAGAARRGTSSPKSWSRDGHLLYLVLCWDGVVDPSGRTGPRSHWCPRRAFDLCRHSGDCRDCRAGSSAIVTTPLRTTILVQITTAAFCAVASLFGSDQLRHIERTSASSALTPTPDVLMRRTK